MKLPTKVRIEMIPMVGRISGNWILKNCLAPVTPSISAASITSSGIESSAA